MATGNTIWLAGDCEHPEFAAATDWLRSNCQCVDRDTSPAAIVVLQSRPGSVSRRQVESLHQLAPLAPLILVTGAWCDGERPTSKAFSGVIRIRWNQWRERLPQALGVPSRLPRTASDGDRLEQALRGLAAGMIRLGTISIGTNCRARFDALADACRALGLKATWNSDSASVQEHVSADLLLIDGWQNDPPADSAANGVLCVLLLDFPRPEDERRAAAMGFAAIIAQPLLLTDLVAVLKRSPPTGSLRSGFAASEAAPRVA